MFRLFLFFAFATFASGGKSPHGQEILAKLNETQRSAIPKLLVEDAMLDVPDLIKKYGYISESYNITTEDKYIVTVHRIAGKAGVTYNNKRPVVFMMHGFMGSSADWIINGPGVAFGYILSDAGYDVWLGNARGNYYSRKHSTLNPDKSIKYWKFSWHEIGFYDIPAMVDFALQKSGQTKLQFIAHSQGTTAFFVMASTRPEYNDKIITMHAMAPIVYNTHSYSPLMKVMAVFARPLQKLLTVLGSLEFMPKNRFLAEVTQTFCHIDSIFINLCVMGLFGGDDPSRFNASMIPVYVAHTPAGASIMQSVHFSQGAISEKFRQYDYGFFGNLGVYGNFVPPDYPLKNIRCPVALYYGDIDTATHPLDVERLFKELKNPIGMYLVSRPLFGHLSFIWSNDAKTVIYNPIIATMKSYEQI